MKRGINRGTGGRVISDRGYTIIESMIFLVVTGALLVSVLGFLGGQQNRTRFNQSLREIDAQLRGTINEVESGYFDDRGGFTCTGGVTVTVSSGGSNTQGTNQACVFMGKVVQFGPSNGSDCSGSNEANCKDYAVHTIVGRRALSSGNTPATLPQAIPTPVFTSTLSPTSPDITEYRATPGSLRVNRIFEVQEGVATNMASVGFLYKLNASNSGQTGSSPITIVSVPISTLGDSKDETFTSIRGLVDSNRNPEQVVICFDEGGSVANSRIGAIVIGGKGRELTTEVIVDARANPPLNGVGGGCVLS